MNAKADIQNLKTIALVHNVEIVAKTTLNISIRPLMHARSVPTMRLATERHLRARTVTINKATAVLPVQHVHPDVPIAYTNQTRFIVVTK